MTWQVYGEGGDNCDSTAQLETIAGAMNKFLSSQNDSICGVKCIKMDHGGTWRGYVTIGTAGEDLTSYHCGSSFSFGSCDSGGNGDSPGKV
ncbi:hypothetical protein BU16DRAFT_521551 [Lophium mytilinum]|uniref:Secreted protein CSS2 C-terminal domain-containing protein n=1 Tax=Lophium mytilinum TaxID=390894 RepID=A0A6A6RGR8_9PEZI|nr:hypothetical protein BU16DRAFT_521551 [Lophium mytilinum]